MGRDMSHRERRDLDAHIEREPLGFFDGDEEGADEYDDDDDDDVEYDDEEPDTVEICETCGFAMDECECDDDDAELM